MFLKNCLRRRVHFSKWPCEILESRRPFSSEREHCQWRVLFFGTGSVALKTLELLNEKKYIVTHLQLVCPQQKETSNLRRGHFHTLQYAQTNSIPIQFYPTKSWNEEKMDYTPVELAAKNANLGIVVDFGHLIPERIINSFPKPPILMHPSLLPNYRGACPIERAIMNGETTTGVTVLEVHPKFFDRGRILLQKPYKIDPLARYPQVKDDLASLGAESVLEVLKNYDHYWSHARPQKPHAKTIKAPKLHSADYLVDWKKNTAKQIFDHWRALSSLTTRLFGCKSLKKTGSPNPNVLLREMHPESQFETPPTFPSHSDPGTIFWDPVNRVVWCKCADNWIAISKLLIAGSKEISAEAYANGTKLTTNRYQSFQSPYPE